MSKVSRPDTLLSVIRDIKERLRKLETSPRLTSASIRGGALRVYNRYGRVSLFMGDTVQDTEFALRREDGTIAVAVFNGGGGVGSNQFVAVYDRSGNVIFSDDTTSGVGHARPWIPIPMTPSLNFASATSTTSGSYTDMLWSTFFKQQPKVDILVWVATDASTSGSLILWDSDNSVQLGSPVAIGAGVSFAAGQWFNIPISGSYGTQRNIVVRAKVTAGAGAIRVLPGYAYGVQS